MASVRPMCLNAARSRSSLLAAMTASRRTANSQRSSVKVAARAPRAAATAWTGVAGPGAAAIAPARSIPAGEAANHFKAFPFISLDITMPNAETRYLLDWEPAHPGLLADLDDGHYFAATCV